MTSTSIAVACIQSTIGTDPDDNLAASIDSIRQAHAQGAKLIVLPELHRSPYFCQTEDVNLFDWAEPLNGPTNQALSQVAAELDIVIVGSIFERRATGLYHNTAIVCDGDRGMVGFYRKMHIPDDPGFYEKFYFTPGDAHSPNDQPVGFQPIATQVGKLGVLVCWDQWFPEAARLMAMAGADILIYPTAIGWDPADTQHEKKRQTDAWITIQRAHAIANGLPIISCNRRGFEASPDPNAGGIEFWGNSFIAGPQGEFLAQAPADNDAILITEWCKQRTHDVRVIWPFFRDRRIDAYDTLTQRWGEKR